MSTQTILTVLADIQSKISVPKGQMNEFGGYKFRSAEDILNAVKPFIEQHKCVLLLTDELVLMMDRFYVKATATMMWGDAQLQVSAFARETETKKGMDEAQVTGSASSYARKYALNGLFCIDDVKDADHHDNREHEPRPRNQSTGSQQGQGGGSDLKQGSSTINRNDFPGFGKHKQGGEDPKKWSEVPKHYLEWLSTADKTKDDVRQFVIQELKHRHEELKRAEGTPKKSRADQVADLETILNGAQTQFKKEGLVSTFAGFLMSNFKTTDITTIAVEYVDSAESIHTDLLNLLKQEKAAKHG